MIILCILYWLWIPVFRWVLEGWDLASWAETLAEEWGAAKLDGAVPKEEGGPVFALEGKCG